MAEPRSRAHRIADTRRQLDEDLDIWVATAGEDGPWLVPLSFLYSDGELLLATDASTRTGRNLGAGGPVRLGLGEVRDLAMIDGEARVGTIAELTDDEAERYVAKQRTDPREWADSLIRVRISRIQAWSESNELPGRTILRDGVWLDP